jgi:protein-tyrosine phosphatase
VLGGGKAEALFIKVYPGFITLPSANKSYHQLFAELSNTDGQPALFDCTTGKDQTGWAAAALLTVLGGCRSSGFIRTISRALITSSPLISRLLPVRCSRWRRGHPSGLARVKAEYLDATFDEVQTEYPLRRISRTVLVSTRQDSVAFRGGR